ncbi:MAG: hypothetical protein AAF358_04480 [Pseudomonadota bacterium]
MNQKPSKVDAALFKKNFVSALQVTQQTDQGNALIRLITLVLAFGLMARAIVVHEVSAAFLLVPLAAEILLSLWTAIILSRTLVDCPDFGSDNLSSTIIITLLIGLISLAVACFPAEGGFAPAQAPAAWVAGVQELWRTGLLLAVIVDAVGLWLASIRDVRRWQHQGGQFVWTAGFGSGMRILVCVLLLIPAPLVIGIMAGPDGEMFQSPSTRAWVTWSFLLCVELALVAISVVTQRAAQKYR